MPEDADPVTNCSTCGNQLDAHTQHCARCAVSKHRVRVRKKKRNPSWGGQSRPKLIVVLIVVAIAAVTAWMLLDALTRKPATNKEVLASRPLTLAAAQQAEYQSASAKA